MTEVWKPTLSDNSERRYRLQWGDPDRDLTKMARVQKRPRCRRTTAIVATAFVVAFGATAGALSLWH